MYHCGIQLDSKGYGHAEQTFDAASKSKRSRASPNSTWSFTGNVNCCCLPTCPLCFNFTFTALLLETIKPLLLEHTETLKMRDIDKVTSLRMEATSTEPIWIEGCVMLRFRCPSRCNLFDSTVSFPSNSATCSFSCLPTTNPSIHSNTHHSITKN